MVFKPATFKPAKPTTTAQPQSVAIPVTPTAQHVSGALTPPASSGVTPVSGSHVEQLVATVVNESGTTLTECGLNPVDVAQSLTQQLANDDLYAANAISDLGVSAAQKINQYSDAMLDHVRCRDLEEMGNNLNEVIGIAKGVDVGALIGKDNLLSKMFSKFKSTKEKILAQFNSVSTQLDRVVAEVEKQQDRLKERATQLDTVFNYNLEEYKALSVAIIYGEVKKRLIQEKLTEFSTQEETPLLAQQRSDLSTLHSRIEKRIHDLKTLQMTALQTAPMIRMVQSNNITLVEKFNNIKMLTIPAWKKQFTLAISMIEQKKSIELANKIDDATNDLIRKNADLLRQNTLSSTQASQRSTIDIETLEHVQSTLISTLQDVVTIEQEGARNRALADQKMIAMKQELSNILQ